MCQFNIEENKLMGTEGEECSLKRIYGKCNRVTQQACKEAELALADETQIEDETLFSNSGELDEKVFNTYVLWNDLPPICI